jgi:chromate transport protein ChrA
MNNTLTTAQITELIVCAVVIMIVYMFRHKPRFDQIWKMMKLFVIVLIIKVGFNYIKRNKN